MGHGFCPFLLIYNQHGSGCSRDRFIDVPYMYVHSVLVASHTKPLSASYSNSKSPIITLLWIAIFITEIFVKLHNNNLLNYV